MLHLLHRAQCLLGIYGGLEEVMALQEEEKTKIYEGLELRFIVQVATYALGLQNMCITYQRKEEHFRRKIYVA